LELAASDVTKVNGFVIFLYFRDSDLLSRKKAASSSVTVIPLQRNWFYDGLDVPMH
jgi:hypothetical protein